MEEAEARRRPRGQLRLIRLRRGQSRLPHDDNNGDWINSTENFLIDNNPCGVMGRILLITTGHTHYQVHMHAQAAAEPVDKGNVEMGMDAAGAVEAAVNAEGTHAHTRARTHTHKHTHHRDK